MKKWLAVAGFALAGGGGLAVWTALPSDAGDQTTEKVSVKFEDFDDSSAERQAPTPTDRDDAPEAETNSSDSREATKASETAEIESSSGNNEQAETEVTVLGIERTDNDRAEESDKRVRQTPEPSHQPMAPAPTEVEDELSSTVDVSRLNSNVHAIPENFGGLKKGKLKVRKNSGRINPNN